MANQDPALMMMILECNPAAMDLARIPIFVKPYADISLAEAAFKAVTIQVPRRNPAIESVATLEATFSYFFVQNIYFLAELKLLKKIKQDD